MVFVGKGNTRRTAMANDELEMFGNTTFVLDVPEAAECTRRMETACNYRSYTITPGCYPVEPVNLDGSKWNSDPAVRTPGYIANTGPYYAVVTVDATCTHVHVENRLLDASSVQDTYPNKPDTVSESVYAYLVKDGARGPFAGSVFRAI
jgi:hypothetical protein